MSGEGLAAGVSTDIEGVIANAEKGEYGPVEVVRSNMKRLLVDLDSPEAVRQFDEVLPIIESMYGVDNVKAWVSSGGNQHRAVTLKYALGVHTRLGLQAMLGSDGVKEALSLKRVREGQSEPIILFKPKQAPVFLSTSSEEVAR